MYTKICIFSHNKQTFNKLFYYICLSMKHTPLQYHFLSILLFLIIALSCKKENTINTEKNIVKDTINLKDKKKIRSIGEVLNPEAQKSVQDWEAYQNLDKLLTTFYSISPNEALTSSEELTKITQQLKDSIKIDRYKQADIAIRINVLHNNALRLTDMTTITTIKSTEIQHEIQHILDAFSALNSKINNITTQEKLEAEVKDILIN